MDLIPFQAGVAAVLLGVLVAAFELGFRAGRRHVAEQDPRAGGQIGAVQGAVLGLLGLLLAFSFSAAASRFLERQDLIVEEANAIGTAWLRADLLAEPHRTELRTALREYTEHRLRIQARLHRGLPREALADVERRHAIIWAAALAGVTERPGVLLGVLPPVNEVIDLHSSRLAAGRKHLPKLVMGLLIGCSLFALASIGYGSGMGGSRRLPITLPLAIVIAAAIWITIDLDHPRTGLLQLNDAPLEALRFDRSPSDPEASPGAAEGRTPADPAPAP